MDPLFTSFPLMLLALGLSPAPATTPPPPPPAVVTEVASGNALSTVAQRHLVRVAPEGQPPVWLLAAQRGDGVGGEGPGLHLYRSDDEGRSWQHDSPIVAGVTSGQPLHLTTDLVVSGDDVAAVISYDTTRSTLPSDDLDPERTVRFQWWRHQGQGRWLAAPLVTVATPEPGHAFHRAELAIDSRQRIWVLAFDRFPCDPSAGVSCEETLRLWVSRDHGQTFEPRPDLDRQSMLGGGRLISLGDRLLVIWGDYSYDNPAQLMVRDDDAPIDRWQGPGPAFGDGDSIYHGAALSAVADGRGGLHLVYKNRDLALIYRHFDGQRFGPALPVDGAGGEGGGGEGSADWALQPAVTLHGDELHVCTNHVTVPDQQNQIRTARLGDRFAEVRVLDGSSDFKTYPTAPERVPPWVDVIPCAYATDGEPGELRVALAPVPTSGTSAAGDGMDGAVTGPAPPLGPGLPDRDGEHGDRRSASSSATAAGGEEGTDGAGGCMVQGAAPGGGAAAVLLLGTVALLRLWRRRHRR